MGWRRRASASATWPAHLEWKRDGVRVLGVRELRGAKRVRAGRVPEVEEALRGIVAGARGGGRGGGGGSPESMPASEGTTAVGRKARARGVSRSRSTFSSFEFPPRPYLVVFKISKFYKIPYHIEFFYTYMKY